MTLEGLKKYEKIIRWIIIIFVIGVFAYSTICTRKLNENRRLCDSYRERCIETERVCDELRNEFGRVREITGRISETADRAITNSRDVAETVELLRVQIQELENICYGYDSIDSYYDWLDRELGLQ